MLLVQAVLATCIGVVQVSVVDDLQADRHTSWATLMAAMVMLHGLAHASRSTFFSICTHAWAVHARRGL
jgi:hypothetical protein